MRVIEIDHSLSPLPWDWFCLIRSLELSTLLSVTAGFNCNKGVGVRAYSSGGNEAKKKTPLNPTATFPLVNLILFPKFCLNFIKPDVWLPAVAVSTQSWQWSFGATTCRGLWPAYFWDCCCHSLRWSWATRIFKFFHTLYVLDTLDYVVWELKSSPQVILEQCLYWICEFHLPVLRRFNSVNCDITQKFLRPSTFSHL